MLGFMSSNLGEGVFSVAHYFSAILAGLQTLEVTTSTYTGKTEMCAWLALGE